MKVAICTPCYDGRVHLQWALSYNDTFMHCIAHNVEPVTCTSRGCANLTRSRNLLVAQALSQGADQIFFIDSDIEWRARDFMRLVAHDEDVVCGVPQKRTQEWLEDGQMAVIGIEGAKEVKGILEVERAPSAFMRIKRGVFEKMARKGVAKPFLFEQAPRESWPYQYNWFWYDLNPLDRPREDYLDWAWGGTPDNRDYVQDDGEDYYFCRKYREIGGKIHIDLDVQLVHYEGLVKHPLNMRQYLHALEESRQSIVPREAA